MRLRHTAELFGIQFANYFIYTLNYRAVASLQYTGVFLTDIVLATFAFISIRRVVNAQTWMERAGYIAGGAAGGVSALWISTFLFVT